MNYQGRPGTEMTSEDDHNLLQGFDDWNDWFGPIPEWPKTRHWYPWVLYEIISKEEADIIVGNTGLKEVHVTKDVRDRILEEAKEWVLVADKKEEETLLWHDDDHSSWTSTELTEDFYKKHVVVKDGHFIGALIEMENVSSYGMAVDRSRDWGILFTNGTSDGETRQHYSHCSTEIDRSEDIQYSLRRKQDADEDK